MTIRASYLPARYGIGLHTHEVPRSRGLPLSRRVDKCALELCVDQRSLEFTLRKNTYNIRYKPIIRSITSPFSEPRTQHATLSHCVTVSTVGGHFRQLYFYLACCYWLVRGSVRLSSEGVVLSDELTCYNHGIYWVLLYLLWGGNIQDGTGMDQYSITIRAATERWCGVKALSHTYTTNTHPVPSAISWLTNASATPFF